MEADPADIKAKYQAQWAEEQNLLKVQLLEEDSMDFLSPGSLSYVGGVDISFVKDSEVDACACLVILKWPSCEVVYERNELIKLTLPYIPSFLAFREVPFLVKLIDEVRNTNLEILPQLIFVDGNGVLHPRGFGLASHLGVLTGIPTIGIGKTYFFVDGIDLKSIKQNFKEKCIKAGDAFLLTGDSGRIWGAAFKSTDSATNPVYVSVGHKICLATAIKLTTDACQYRVPEPVRQADLRSREYLRKNEPK